MRTLVAPLPESSSRCLMSSLFLVAPLCNLAMSFFPSGVAVSESSPGDWLPFWLSPSVPASSEAFVSSFDSPSDLLSSLDSSSLSDFASDLSSSAGLSSSSHIPNFEKAMARTLLLPFLPLLLSLLCATTGAAVSGDVASTSFIKTSCSATTYPALCFQSLSIYASTIQRSPRQLAQTALAVSLARAQSARTFMSRLAKFKGLKHTEYEAIHDCLEEVGEGVDRLSKSIAELKSMGRARGPEYLWHISNVETWVSAALTDDNSCMDGFAGRALDGKIKASVRARVTNVAQVTSNALALVNHFGAKN